jgi:hypothetical protein
MSSPFSSTKSLPYSDLTWEGFNKFASEVQNDECKSIELYTKKDEKLKIGFFIKSSRTDELLFYQIGKEAYKTGKDYVYGLKYQGDSQKPVSVFVFNREDEGLVTKISLKPYDSPENVRNILSKSGIPNPWDVNLYFESGLTDKEKQSAKPAAFNPVKRDDKLTLTDEKTEKNPQTGHKQEKPQTGNKQGKSQTGNKQEKSQTEHKQEKPGHKREGTVPVTFEWPYPCTTAEVTGSFCDWKSNIYTLHKEGSNLVTRINLLPGAYQYKFIVDKTRWCYDILKPTLRDKNGNVNNQIVVVKKDDE